MVDSKEDLIPIIESIPIGEKITITMLSLLKKPYDFKCRLMDHPRQRGYLSKIGAWSTNSVDSSDVPCYEIMVRKKACSSTNTFIRLNKIHVIGKGW